MIVYHVDPNGDLVEELTKPELQPVRYRHKVSGTLYTVLSSGEYHLNIFSLEGSKHQIFYQGYAIVAEFQHSGQPKDDAAYRGYAGRIVVYVGEDGKAWIRPEYEFYDGRFIKEDVCSQSPQ